MTDAFNNMTDLLATDQMGTIKLIALGYFGLLWVSIIIWVTKDILSRSNNILVQMFSILINIIMPILGVLVYLIIRPGKTHLERYYEEMEAEILGGEEDQIHITMCEKCMTPVEKEYLFCPNCAHKLKKECLGCKKNFPNIWQFCPFCGIEYKEKIEKLKKTSIKQANES